MTWLGFSNGRISAILAACLYPAFLLLPLLLQAATLEEKRAARLDKIGIQIGSTPGFDVYSPMARNFSDKIVCNSGLTQDQRLELRFELEDQRQAVNNEWVKAQGIQKQQFDEEMQALIQRRSKMSAEAFQNARKTMLERQSREKQSLNDRYSPKLQELANQQKAIWNTGVGDRLDIYVLHRPSSKTAPIVPTVNAIPTETFVTALNKVLGDFVATCEHTKYVLSSHYYADAFRFAEKDRGIVGFRFDIAQNGQLSATPCKSNCDKALAHLDPSKNLEMSLRGFIAAEMAAARNAGTYRKSHAYSSARQEGIVYKLDPYWANYEDFDIARRIFDGDFGEYRDTVEFKAFYTGLATSYSKYCKSHVTQWQSFERAYDAYKGTSHNLDGSKTIRSSEQTKTYQIDARFGKHWAQYDSDLSRAVLKQGVFESFGLVLGLRGEMDTFIKSHACDSAVVKQMTENFIRAANAQPSVQQDGLRFADASSESDAATKTGTPPPPFTPVANTSEINESIKAANNAFGEGILFGEHRNIPTLSKEEFDQEVDRVAKEGQDNLNRAARNAEQSLTKMEAARRDAADARSALEKRLIELIKERNQTPENSQRHKDLQNTINITIQHMGLTKEPAVPTESTARTSTMRNRSHQIQTEQNKSNAQSIAARRERIRQIDQETNEKIQTLVQAQHQAQVEAGEIFRQKIASSSVPEQSRLLENYKKQQREEGEQLRARIQALRAEANERKKQL